MTKLSIGILVAVAAIAVALAAAPARHRKGRRHPRSRDVHEVEHVQAEAERGGWRGSRSVRGRPEPERRALGSVTLLQNGTRIARMTRVTGGRSGSFEARVVASDTAGKDAFRARATRTSAEVCSAQASF